MRDLSATELQAGVFTIVSCVATFVAYDIAGRRVAAVQPSESDRRRPRPRRVVGVMAVLLLLVGTAWWSVGTVGGSVAASSLPSPYSVAQLAFQLATNSVLLAPFVIWMVRRRRGSADFGIERADLGRSLAVGAAVSLACFLMSGRYAAAFWTSPDTLRLLIAMLGVGLSEEVLFRGILLGTLVRRMPRPRAEVASAVVFSLVHIPQRVSQGPSTGDLIISLVQLFVWGWCFSAAMRAAWNVPGLALVHAVINVCVD